MTTAESLFYSASHWRKQLDDLFKNSVVYEGRVARGEICTQARAAEVMASQRDRIFYANVVGSKMECDPLRIAGISFGVMLSDTKKELAAEIDKCARQYEREEDLRAAVTSLYFQQSARLNARRWLGAWPVYHLDHGAGRDYAATRKVFYESARRAGKTVVIEKLIPGEPVKDHGLALDHCIADEAFDYYDAILAHRKHSGYYDPWYLKAWNKFKRLFS